MGVALHQDETDPPGRVLVVDDDEDFADAVKDLLDAAGYAAQVAFDWPAAERGIQEFRPAVVLIDVRLGTKDGGQLVERIKARFPATLCVMMSAYTSADTAIEALKRGAYDYLRKPFHEDDLFATLGRCFTQLSLELQTRNAEESLISRNVELERQNQRQRHLVEWMQSINTSSDTLHVCRSLIDLIVREVDAHTGAVYIESEGELELVHDVCVAKSVPDHEVDIARSRAVSQVVDAELRTHVTDDMPNPPGMLITRYVRADGGLAGIVVLTAEPGREFGTADNELCLISLSFAVELIRALRARAAEAELESRLQQAQKMESLGLLSGGIAHDFNNMLASIMGFGDLAVDSLDNPAEARSHLDQIARAAQRASELTAKMLKFSRRAPQDVRPVDMKSTLEECASLLRASLPATIGLVVDVSSQLPKVMVDPISLHQIVMNLCVNARDAMSGKGRIEVTAHPFVGDEQTCHSCGEAVEGEFVALNVTDDGVGMSPETLSRAFEPFFTTKAVGKGTGMGLSMIHGVVHDSGGHVLVQSSPECGTSFSLLFEPGYEEGDDHSNDATAASRLRAVSGRVLVVDDDASIARMIGRCLEKEGCEVIVLFDSTEAQHLIRNRDEQIDFLVCRPDHARTSPGRS